MDGYRKPGPRNLISLNQFQVHSCLFGPKFAHSAQRSFRLKINSLRQIFEIVYFPNPKYLKIYLRTNSRKFISKIH